MLYAAMRRFIGSGATWISVGLLVVLALLCIRSVYARDRLKTFVFGHECLVETFPNHVNVILAAQRSRFRYGTVLETRLTQYPSRMKYLEPRWSDVGGYHHVSIPFWLLALPLAVMPVWRLSQWRRRLVFARKGLCIRCGYDVRASTDRCPECGEPIVAS
jgi:hypothetical protein